MGWDELAGVSNDTGGQGQSQVSGPARSMAGALGFLIKITTPPSLD